MHGVSICFSFLLTHPFNFSKKSEHLHQPNKQIDNQEDKVGADDVQRCADFWTKTKNNPFNPDILRHSSFIIFNS